MILLMRSNKQEVGYINEAAVSYKKPLHALWSAEMKLKEDNPMVKHILPFDLVDIMDDFGEYIGMFRILPESIEKNEKTGTITYQMFHVFHTCSDFVVKESKKFIKQPIGSIINWLLSNNLKGDWSFHNIGAPELKMTREFQTQNGLTSPIFSTLKGYEHKYFFTYNTLNDDWKIELRKREPISCRIKEGYNMDSFGIVRDPSQIINRIFGYGAHVVEQYEDGTIVTQSDIEKEEKVLRDWENKKKAIEKRNLEKQKIRKQQLDARRQETEERRANGTLSEMDRSPIPPANLEKIPKRPEHKRRKRDRLPITISHINGGKPYIEDLESINKYGVFEYILNDAQYETAESLLEAMNLYLQGSSGMITTVTCTAKDLIKASLTPLTIDNIRLGRTVQFETDNYGVVEMIITEESKKDIFSKPEEIDIVLSIDSNSMTKYSPIQKVVNRAKKDIDREIMNVGFSANGKNRIFYGPITPLDPKIDDVWFDEDYDTTTGLVRIKMKIWNGYFWELPEDVIDQSKKDLELNLDIVDEASTYADYLGKEVDAKARKAIQDYGALNTAFNVYKVSNDSRVSAISNGLGDLNIWKQTADSTMSIITDKKKKGLLSVINQQAGNVLISVGDVNTNSKLNITKNGTYIENGIIENAHIKDGTINSAKINYLAATKIVGGTLDASKIVVTNLDSSAITSGTLNAGIIKSKNGLSYWNLDTGEVRIISDSTKYRNVMSCSDWFTGNILEKHTSGTLIQDYNNGNAGFSAGNRPGWHICLIPIAGIARLDEYTLRIFIRRNGFIKDNKVLAALFDEEKNRYTYYESLDEINATKNYKLRKNPDSDSKKTIRYIGFAMEATNNVSLAGNFASVTFLKRDAALVEGWHPNITYHHMYLDNSGAFFKFAKDDISLGVGIGEGMEAFIKATVGKLKFKANQIEFEGMTTFNGGFKIYSDGENRGKFSAKAGWIGNWVVKGTSIRSTDNKVGMSTDSSAFWAGYDPVADVAQFRVTRDGYLSARNFNGTGKHYGYHEGRGDFGYQEGYNSNFDGYISADAGRLAGSSFDRNEDGDLHLRGSIWANSITSTLYARDSLYMWDRFAPSGTAYGYRRVTMLNGYWEIENSDIRLKENITNSKWEDSSWILDLTPITYNYKEDKSKQKYVGFNANKLIKLNNVVGSLVNKQSDGYYGINYELFTPHIINVLKEQQKKIKELEESVNKYENNRSDDIY